MPATNPLDFSSAASAATALKKVKQLMIRAGQAVVATEFIDKAKRSNGMTYREALLTLASGQIVTLRVTATGDIYQVLLNNSVVPIKAHDDTAKAVAEIAALAEKNQAAFQKAQARKAIALPPGMSTPAPKMAVVLTERVAQLDTQIAERRVQVNELKAQLGQAALLDGVNDLSGAETDTLAALVNSKHALEAGDIPSKVGLQTLIERGYAEDDSGVYHATDAGKARLKAMAPALLDSLAVAYIAARDIVAGKPELLDSVGTGGAVAVLRIALETVETNYPINLAAGNLEQAELEKRNAESFRLAIGMLDSAGPALSDTGLTELVGIAAVSAAEDGDIKSQAALAELLALGLVETTDGLYMVTGKGKSALDDAGYDVYGEPYAANAD
jgi:hypothetical protein